MEELQSADTVLMIRPDSFQFNEQTAATNAFQRDTANIRQPVEKAQAEFQQMAAALQAQHIRVIILGSRADVPTPDAVFPNNWFSTHRTTEGVTVILYPLLAENRRFERIWEVLRQALEANDVPVKQMIDLSHFEKQNKFLEGTGSVILDRVNHIAYAALSPRTDETVLREFAVRMDYQPVIFHSYDKAGVPVYHTNVMLSIGSAFAVVAAQSITDQRERDEVLNWLGRSGRQIIPISQEQMAGMAGNILEVRSVAGKPKIIMSRTAYGAFSAEQRQALAGCGDLVVVDIDTIERLGGGSARCMLAEVF